MQWRDREFSIPPSHYLGAALPVPPVAGAPPTPEGVRIGLSGRAGGGGAFFMSGASTSPPLLLLQPVNGAPQTRASPNTAMSRLENNWRLLSYAGPTGKRSYLPGRPRHPIGSGCSWYPQPGRP